MPQAELEKPEEGKEIRQPTENVALQGSQE
jgi:hypothetical protein